MMFLIRLTIASVVLFWIYRETGPATMGLLAGVFLATEFSNWERSSNDANREKIDRETIGRNK